MLVGIGSWMILAGFTPHAAFALPELLRLQSFPTHSRLIFKLETAEKPVLTSSVKGFEVLFQKVQLDEFLSKEEVQLLTKEIASQTDDRTQGLRLEQVKDGVKISGLWKYPTGKDALAKPQMETFEVSKQDEFVYTLDFWIKTGAKAVEVKEATEKKEKKDLFEKARAEAQEVEKRQKLAASKKNDLEGTEKFCREALSDQNDWLVSFRAMHEPLDFSKYFPLSRPDENYPYLQKEFVGQESEFLKIAYQHYKASRFGMAVKSLNVFESKFPKSKDLSDVLFLKANSLFKFAEKKKGEDLLERIVKEFPHSSAALPSLTYLSIRNLKDEQYLVALDHFIFLAQNYPTHRLYWLFKLGIAESLYGIREVDRTLKAYEEVIPLIKDQKLKAEIAARRGDILVSSKQFDQAVALYFQTDREYPNETKKMPAFQMNRAESLFWLGQLEDAEKAFKAFLKNFSSLNSGWKASFRLGEIALRRNSKEDRIAARKWFYETINSYPFSDGAILARLRLIPCGDHAGFDTPKLDSFFSKEAVKIFDSKEVAVDGFADGLSLTRARAYVGLGDYSAAIKFIETELGQNISEKTRQELRRTYLASFRRNAIKLVKKGKGIHALKEFDRSKEFFPKQEDEDVLEFLVELADSASKNGLTQLAEEILNLKKRMSTHDENQNQSVAVSSWMNAQQNSVSAKILWNKKGIAAEKEIREILEKIPEESSHWFERELLQAKLEEAKKNFPSAILHSIKAEMNCRSLYPHSCADLLFWTAHLYEQNHQEKEAVAIYKDLIKIYATFDKKQNFASYGIKPVLDKKSLEWKVIDYFEKTAAWDDLTSELQKRVEAGSKDNQTLYRYAIALENTKAVDAKSRSLEFFKQVSESRENDFWKSLAMNALISRTTEGKP